MTLLKYVIPEQKELYRFKNYLSTLGIGFNSTKKYYSNEVMLNEDEEKELIDFLTNKDFKYQIEKVSIKSKEKEIESKYKILKIDKYNYFIVDRTTNKKLYMISIDILNKNIHFLDIENSFYKSFKIDTQNIQTENDLIIIMLEKLSENQNDFKKLFKIFTVLANGYNEETLLYERLQKFKYLCIAKIQEQNKDSYLCNNVPSFNPESKFYIKNNKIFSSITENYLTAEQEKRVWKYLFSNQQLIGKYIEPTIEELFLLRKINVKDSKGEICTTLINKIEPLQNDRFKITVNNGNKDIKIDKDFSKDELREYIKKAY